MSDPESELHFEIDKLRDENRSLRDSLIGDAIPVIEMGISLINELDQGVRGIEPVSSKVSAMKHGIFRINQALKISSGEK